MFADCNAAAFWTPHIYLQFVIRYSITWYAYGIWDSVAAVIHRAVPIDHLFWEAGKIR